LESVHGTQVGVPASAPRVAQATPVPPLYVTLYVHAGRESPSPHAWAGYSLNRSSLAQYTSDVAKSPAGADGAACACAPTQLSVCCNAGTCDPTGAAALDASE
jgi:hypothetical protein